MTFFDDYSELKIKLFIQKYSYINVAFVNKLSNEISKFKRFKSFNDILIIANSLNNETLYFDFLD